MHSKHLFTSFHLNAASLAVNHGWHPSEGREGIRGAHFILNFNLNEMPRTLFYAARYQSSLDIASLSTFHHQSTHLPFADLARSENSRRRQKTKSIHYQYHLSPKSIISSNACCLG